MDRYLEIAARGYRGYAGYLWREITEPGLHSYFYLLLAVSLFFLVWEQVRPWRKEQPRLREGFFVDAFYMVFNFFLFSLLGWNAVGDVVEAAFRDALRALGLSSLAVVDARTWPAWAQLLTLFLVRDFVQYWIHRLLHRVPFLWRIHQVHHSVRQMGFAAHLRFHFGETIVYRAIEYVPLAMIGFGLTDFFAVHAFALTVGHFNHSNVKLPLGPLRYVLNNPQMHIWHHAKTLPPGTTGVNFGLTLSVWDYLFGTAHVPSDGRDIELGFEHVERYPRRFLTQLAAPFRGP
jgi:sterol desaturase/sphingolipid hydroxylase (fatty acid hydroxylase superfamily)